MRPRDLSALIFSNLKRMKLRLALTSMGVVIGTTSIVLMVSLGIGLQRNIEQELVGMGPATHITVIPAFTPGSMEMPALDSQAISEIEEVANVEAVMGQVWVETMGRVEFQRRDVHLSAMGVPMDKFEQFGYVVERGRLPRNENEIVLGARMPSMIADEGGFREDLTEDLLGGRLNATFFEPATGGAGGRPDEAELDLPAETTRRLTVVGILAPADTQVDSTAFVTMDAALEFNGVRSNRIAFPNAIARADSPANVAAVEEELRALGYETFSASSLQEGMRVTFLIIQGVLGALGGISMLVAALGIANTMTMSIFERTREIGIMKAVGASGNQIKKVFLGEAAAIGLLGGTVGLLFSVSTAAVANLVVQGLIATEAVGQQAGAAAVGTATQTAFFIIPVWLGVFALVFAAGVGLLAGILPAMRAANLDPLIALRHE